MVSEKKTVILDFRWHNILVEVYPSKSCAGFVLNISNCFREEDVCIWSQYGPILTNSVVATIFDWVSDCCLKPTQQFFSYIMARTS
jgi:hypothetical protein